MSKSKINAAFATILPGIFLIGYNVGTGSITAMSKAGANFGLDLLWTVALSCLITYYLMVLFGRFTLASGYTAIQGIKNFIHPLFAKFLIIVLSGIILVALVGVLGIIVEVLEIGTKTLTTASVPNGLWAALVAFLIFGLVWKGNTATFEKILAILVAVMGLTFIATALINFPSLKDLLSGFVPTMPTIAEGSDNSPMVIVAGMVGTTVSAFVFIIRTQILHERAWTPKDRKIQRRDALVSASLMFIISAAIMITAATTLYEKGVVMNNVVEMIPLLEPIAGRAAVSVFVIGILAAGISSHLPNLLVIPWLMMDYSQRERDIRKPKIRGLLFLLTMLTILGVIYHIRPVFVLMISQTFLAILLPLLVGSIFYLTNQKHLMGEGKNGIFDNSVLSLILCFSLYMCFLGLQGVVADLA